MELNDPEAIDTEIARLEREESEGAKALASLVEGTHAHRAVARELERDRAQLAMVRRHKDAVERPAKERAQAEQLRQKREAVRRESRARAEAARNEAAGKRDRIVAAIEKAEHERLGRVATPVEILEALSRLDESAWAELAAAAGVTELGQTPALVMAMFRHRAEQQQRRPDADRQDVSR